MAIKNTNTSPLLKEGANITLTQSGQVITIAANDTTNAPGGSDTQVQFNDGGSFGGDAGLTYNKTTNVLGVESIDFAQTPAATDSVRRLKWDEDEGSLVLTLKGGNLTIPVGAEVVTLVYNAEATTLTKGTVVYAFGASGQRVSVKRAVNTGDSTSAQTLGVVAESIASGAEGWVMVQGLVRGIDTSAYTQGDALYLGATAGTFTKTKVYAPNHLVYVGFAVKINASSGEIFVKCQNGYELDELHNVDAHNPTNNDGIFWNSSTNLWEHKSIVTVLGYTPAPASRMITINGTSQDLTADRTWSVGTVTSVGITAGTGISVANSPVTGSGSITVTNTAPDQTVSLTQGGTTTITGTYPNFTISSADQYVGTVTSVGLSAPTGFSVANSPVISSGTLALSFASGYSLPTTASQTNWDAAYNDKINSASVTGTTTKTLTLNQQDGGTVTASWTDLNTDAVTSVFGRTGAVTAQSGDYTTAQVTESGNLYYTDARARLAISETITGIDYNNSTGVLSLTSGYVIPTTTQETNWDTAYTNRITSLTTTGSSGAATLISNTLNIPNYTLAGLGGFANPMTTLGDVIYGAASGVATRLGGNTTTAKQYLSQTGTGTVSAAPSWSAIDGADVTGAALTKTDDTNVTLTLGGTPATSLLRAASLTLGWTGQLAVSRGGTGLSTLGTANQLLRVNSGATALEYWTPTYISSAITSLGGLTAATQTFATGTSGTDFNISSATSTHTFNIPTASGTNRGALSSADWSTFNGKENVLTFSSPLSRSTNTISIPAATGSVNGYLTSTDWTTFNNKQNALTNPVTGTGTSGQVAYFNGTTSITSESNLFWDATNDRLGIGTASPGNKLDVIGNLLVQGTQGFNATNESASIFLGDSASEIRAVFDGGMDFYQNSVFRMRIQGSTGNVGIGTTSPAALLEVNKDGAANGTQQEVARFANRGSTATSAYIHIAASTGRDWKIGKNPRGVTDSTNFEITDDLNNSRLFISASNGNVGIGTTTDSGYKLDVNGNIRSYLNTTFDSENGTLIAANGSTPAKAVHIGYDSAKDAGYISTIYSGVAWKNLLLQAGGGNVLIGTTTSSTYKLDVNGTGRFSSDVTATLFTGKHYTGATYNFEGGYLGKSSGNGGALLELVAHTDVNPSSSFALRYDQDISGNLLIQYASPQTSYSSLSYTALAQLTSSGNLGLGVTPSAWESPYKVIQFGTVGSIYQGTSENTGFGNNLYVNTSGSSRYLVSNYATFYDQYLGQHRWFNAPSGSATAAITFTQAMTLDASGNLGLGVTPSAWGSSFKAIDINSYGSLVASTAAVNILANSYYNGTDYIYKANGLATMVAQTGGYHQWFTAPSGTAGNAITFTQAMTLDASGRLLIGNTSNVDGSALQVNANTVGSTVYTALFENTSTSTSAYNSVRFRQGAAGSATGYVGTGGSATGNTSFRNTFVVGTQSNHDLVFNTNDAEKMRLTANGDLIIGSGADTGESLQVTGNGKFTHSVSGETTLKIRNSNVLGFSGIEYFDSAGNVDLYIGLEQGGGGARYNALEGGHKLYNNSVEHLNLKTTGQLKLNAYTTTTSFSGTTTGYLAFTDTGDVITKSPANVLSEIGAQASLTNPVTGTGTNNEIAYFNSTGSTIASLPTATYPSLTELSYVKGVTSSIQTQLNAKGSGTIGGTGTTNYISKFSASSTLANSSITDDGTIVDLLQGQLRFPSTQNPANSANILDDYEEGTWTPTYTSSTGSFTTLTYNKQHGAYQKIGNRVYINGILATNSVTIGTASGDLRIQGLPFSMNSSTDAQAGFLTFPYVLTWASDPPATAKSNSTTQWTLYRQRDLTTDENTATVTPSDMTTGSVTGANECWFFGWYISGS